MILGLIAVVIDRLNFPQRKFRPKTVSIEPKERRAARDRTGAHIVDFDPKPADPNTRGSESRGSESQRQNLGAEVEPPQSTE